MILYLGIGAIVLVALFKLGPALAHRLGPPPSARHRPPAHGGDDLFAAALRLKDMVDADDARAARVQAARDILARVRPPAPTLGVATQVPHQPPPPSAPPAAAPQPGAPAARSS